MNYGKSGGRSVFLGLQLEDERSSLAKKYFSPLRGTISLFADVRWRLPRPPKSLKNTSSLVPRHSTHVGKHDQCGAASSRLQQHRDDSAPLPLDGQHATERVRLCWEDAIERVLVHQETNAVRGAYHRGQHWMSASTWRSGGATSWTRNRSQLKTVSSLVETTYIYPDKVG